MSRARAIAAGASVVAMLSMSIALTTLGASLAPATALTLYATLFLPYIALIVCVRRLPASVNPRHVLIATLGVAVLLRVVFAWSDPLFSDDIFRYVWDGRIGAAGINPYIHAPAGEALSALRDTAIWPRINHPEIPTIYPPMAQLVFHLNALLGPFGGTTSLRLLFAFFEFAMLAGCWAIFAQRPKPSTTTTATEDEAAEPNTSHQAPGLVALVIYLLNPLVLVEGIWSGHIDILAWGTLALSLVMFTHRTSRSGSFLAGLLLGASVALKLISVIFLPLFLLAPNKAKDDRRELILKRALFAIAMPLMIAVTYLPYVSAGSQMFDGFGAYASRWRGNDGPFRAIMYMSAVSMKRWAKPEQRQTPNDPGGQVFVTLSGLGPLYTQLGWTKQWEGKTIPANTYADDQASQTIAKLIVAGLMGLMLLWCLIVVRDPLKGSLLLLGTLFFLAPTLYPWYVAWLVPLAALSRYRSPLLFGALSLTAYLAWVSHAGGGEWVVPWWAVSIEFGLVFVVVFYEVTRAEKHA